MEKKILKWVLLFQMKGKRDSKQVIEKAKEKEVNFFDHPLGVLRTIMRQIKKDGP